MTTPEYAMMMAQEYKMDSLKKENEKLKRRMKNISRSYESLIRLARHKGMEWTFCDICKSWIETEDSRGCVYCTNGKSYLCEKCYDTKKFRLLKQCTDQNCKCKSEKLECEFC